MNFKKFFQKLLFAYVVAGILTFIPNAFVQAAEITSKSSILECTKAIEENPEYAEAYYWRGIGYGKKTKYEEAVEDLTKAIELNPNYTDAYWNRGLVFQEISKFIVYYSSNGRSLPFKKYSLQQCYENAKNDFTKTIKLNEKNGEYYSGAYYRRGEIYMNMGENKKAVEDLTKAIKIEPDSYTLYYVRGLAYQNLEQDEKAQADFEKSKELGMPKDFPSRYEMF